MSIEFIMHNDQGYYITKYSGAITDDELLQSWDKFYSSDKWRPGLNNLSDLSQVSIERITGDGVIKFTEFVNKVYKENNGGDRKAAIYVADIVLFGIARMFTSWMGETQINFRIFEDKDEAMNWLLSEEEDALEQAGQ